MSDSFRERQRAHAEDFQRDMQALYASIPDASVPPLAGRLREIIAELEAMRPRLPDPVNQGKVLAALHILRSVLDGLAPGLALLVLGG